MLAAGTRISVSSLRPPVRVPYAVLDSPPSVALGNAPAFNLPCAHISHNLQHVDVSMGKIRPLKPSTGPPTLPPPLISSVAVAYPQNHCVTFPIHLAIQNLLAGATIRRTSLSLARVGALLFTSSNPSSYHHPPILRSFSLPPHPPAPPRSTP